MRLLVLAKQPRAGHVKTRLTSRYAPEEAAALAAAALQDTLEAARCCAADVELVVDGPLSNMPGAVAVSAQAEGSLGERLHAAFADRTEPSLLVGMDTPQVTAALLDAALAHLATHDAVLGLAADGGWWALGFREPGRWAHLVRDVPTSTATTGTDQLSALTDAGLSTAMLPVLLDVDEPSDADRVAATAPATRFARLHRQLGRGAA